MQGSARKRAFLQNHFRLKVNIIYIMGQTENPDKGSQRAWGPWKTDTTQGCSGLEAALGCTDDVMYYISISE
jgi:hypothetical protein